LTQARAQYVVGDPVERWVSFTNSPSNPTLTNVTVVDTIPADLTYTGCGGVPSCSDASGMVIWNVGTLAPGASFSVTYYANITTCSTNAFQDTAAVYVDSPPVLLGTNVVDFTVACFTNTPTMTATSTISDTPSFTPTNTNTPPPTNTPTITSTPTLTPTYTNTFTPTVTSTNTNTFTPTATPTITNTSPPTSTFTATPTYTPTCVTYVWPDPYNPQKAVGGTLRISCMNPQSVVTIYTISGELVQTLNYQTSPCTVPNMWGTAYCWNGTNTKGRSVATGVYLYVVQQGTTVVQRGKFLVVNGS
jgi:hypothetical protein